MFAERELTGDGRLGAVRELAAVLCKLDLIRKWLLEDHFFVPGVE